MGSESFISFGKSEFNRLFPFYILVGSDNTIISFGESLKKIYPISQGDQFYDVFSLRRFTTGGLDFPALPDLRGQVVILNYRSPEVDVFLRGEITAVDNDDRMLFIGTPWFGSMEELVGNNLTISDFALHDPMVDLLHVLKTQEITTNETRELLQRVNNQSDVLKSANNDLKASENRLFSLIEHLQSGVLLENQERRIVVANSTFCDMFSIPVAPALLIGADCSKSAEQSKHMFLHPDHFVDRITEILHDRKHVLAETLETADGRFLERDYIPIFVEDEYRGNLWKYTDITHRIKYERNLKAQEEKYRSIIENMNLGLLEVNLEDKVEYANQSFCSMSGYAAEELIGRVASQLFTSPDVQQMINEKNSLRQQGISDTYEIWVRDRAGEIRWWLVSGAPNFNEKGNMVGTIGIHLDITKQKLLEEELREAKLRAEVSAKAKESFLANMSHEIRTPLNAIIGMVRELNHTDLDPMQYSYVSHAKSASQHLLSIVNNILDMSKIEAGQLHLDNRPFSLHDVIRDTEVILGPAAREKMLSLEVKYRADPEILYLGDPNRLRQVLINITSNSIKFTEKGSVRIICESLGELRGEDILLITIEDTGIGMEQSFLKNLFKKFSQESVSIAQKYGGTGLGMAITNELIQLMNGHIDVQSEKGAGTRFRVRLSFRKDTELAEEQLHTGVNAASLPKLKVLLVEDSPLNRLVAHNSMRRHGFNVVEARNGQEAVDILATETFDLVLMDMQMPVMDGLEATLHIRNVMNIETPIVALTANVFRSEVEKCFAAGMNDFVVKPFEEKLLINSIYKNVNHQPAGVVFPGQKQLVTEHEELYNLAEFNPMMRGNLDFLKKVIQLFSEEVLTSVDDMRAAVMTKDYVAVRRIVHKIKPSFQVLGVRVVRGDLDTLGKASDEISLERLVSSVDKVKSIANEVVTAMKKELE